MENKNFRYASILREVARRIDVMEEPISQEIIDEIEEISEAVIINGRKELEERIAYKEFMRNYMNKAKFDDSEMAEEDFEEAILNMKNHELMNNSVDFSQYTDEL